MKNIKNYDFYSLKPPREAFAFKIPADEIKKIVNGTKKRNIFSLYDYDPEELQAIESIKSSLGNNESK